MRAVIQRVSKASVTVDGEVISRIGTGLLVLLGVEDADTPEDADWLVRKIIQLRIFADEQGLMNKSLQDVGGDLLVVSQFTLFARPKRQPPEFHPSRPTRSCHTFVRRVRAAGRKPAGQTGGHRIIRRHDGSGPGEQRTGYHHHRHKEQRVKRIKAFFRDTPRSSWSS